MAYIRKSRAILLIISVILLHIIVISLFKYNDHPYVTQTKLNILELRKALLSYNQSRDTSDTTTFNENVEKIISSAGIQAVSRFPKEYYDIEIPNSQSFDAELAERTPDINENSDNSDEQVVMIEENEPNYFNLYDPRFTFAITFNYLSHQIAEGKSINNLPFFHWGDYVDLSQLNQFIYNPKKFPCKKFDTSTKSKIQNKKNLLKKPEEYCFDDDDISATLEQAAADNDLNIINNLKLIQSSRYSTGFHVLRSPGRQKLVSRSILSKSYLNDFMTLPFSLTFLLPNEKLFQVSIDQNILSTKQRILNTDYVKNNLINRNLNLVDELNHFLLVADSLVKDTAKVTPFKNLTHDLFVDNSQEIFNSLKESSSSLNASEKLYFTSLERSLDQSRDAVKYFEEANLVRNERNYGIGGHYDWRFFSEIINYTDLQSPVLHGLVKAWLRFTNRVGINTWIAHGSLLSWYWDALNFPWDNDIDVQMSIQDLHHLSRHYNQTIVVDFGDNPEQPRFGRYFLDCGTYISRRVRGNGANNIDARFIDMDTGAYIDITALALSDTEPPERYNDYLPKDQFQHRRTRKQVIIDSLERNKHLQAYNCRNNHFSRLVELSPLRLTVFEGERAYIAHSYEQSLLNEYGEKSLFLQTFRGYTFLPKLRNWVKVEAIVDFIKKFGIEKVQEQSRQSKNNSKRIAVIKDFLDQDYEKLLGYNHDVLREYYVTQQVTDYHDVEMVALTKPTERNSIAEASLDPNKVSFLRPDYYTFKHGEENQKLSFIEQVKQLHQTNKQHRTAGLEQIKNDLQNLEFKQQIQMGQNEVQESRDLAPVQKEPLQLEDYKSGKMDYVLPPRGAVAPPQPLPPMSKEDTPTIQIDSIKKPIQAPPGQRIERPAEENKEQSQEKTPAQAKDSAAAQASTPAQAQAQAQLEVKDLPKLEQQLTDNDSPQVKRTNLIIS